jgi:hypothetical protein
MFSHFLPGKLKTDHRPPSYSSTPSLPRMPVGLNVGTRHLLMDYLPFLVIIDDNIDHHLCGSAPSEITRVWFYIYPMPQKLLILEFRTPSSRWHYADVARTSRRPVQQYAGRHWGSPTTLTQQRKSVCHLCCIWYFNTTPDTTGTPRVKFKKSFLRNILRWW